MADERPYGMLAEFKDPESLLRASKATYAAGFRRLDAYTPFPVEGLAEAIGLRHDLVAPIALLGGLVGGVCAFGMQWFADVYSYPIDVAGRPDFSWPAFIPITFELTVLGAALFGAIGMLALNRLPKPWHPLFGNAAFTRASRDRFFLCVLATDRRYDPGRVRELLDPLAPVSLSEVKDEE